MRKKKNNDERGLLLPRYFKIVGAALVAPAAIVMIMKVANPQFKDFVTGQLASGQINAMLYAAIIAGVFMIGWARDKDEDERSLQLRFQSIMDGVLFGIGMMIFKYVAVLVSTSVVWYNGGVVGFEIILQVMLFYIVRYRFSKYQGGAKERKNARYRTIDVTEK